MASPSLKRKQPSGRGTITIGSSDGTRLYGSTRGVLGHLAPPEPSRRQNQRTREQDNVSWVIHTFTPYDGHFWRKYGEKNIKGARFQRKYFRCSYCDDRHCSATKLVEQQNSDIPPLYKVTYTHKHTCNAAAPVPPHDVVAAAEPPHASGEGLVLSFGCSIGSGSYHRGGQMEQERQRRRYSSYHQQPAAPCPFMMLNFDCSWNGQLQQQPAAFATDVPQPTETGSSLLPMTGSSPQLLSRADSDDDPFSLSALDWELLSAFGGRSFAPR